MINIEEIKKLIIEKEKKYENQNELIKDINDSISKMIKNNKYLISVSIQLPDILSPPIRYSISNFESHNNYKYITSNFVYNIDILEISPIKN